MAAQKTILDHENYSELSKPFTSPSEANKAVEGFWEEFYELRNKYKLQDVHAIISMSIQYEGDVGSCMLSMHAGNEMMAEPMCAWALGYAQAERQENIARLLSNEFVKRGKKRK